MGLYFLKSQISIVKIKKGIIFFLVCIGLLDAQTGFGRELSGNKFSPTGLRIDTTHKLFNLKKGDHVPEHYLKMLIGNKKTKLILLDFWSTYCTSCIASFPKLEKLKKHFDSELEIVLINSAETEDEAKTRFSKMNMKSVNSSDEYMPNFPRIFKDTIFKYLFPFLGVPHCVWIDGSGKVMQITNGPSVTMENIGMAIDGKELKISQKSYLETDNYEDYVQRGSRSFSKRRSILEPYNTEIVPAFYSAFISYSEALAGREYGYIDSVAQTYKSTLANRSYLELIKRLYPFRDATIFFEGERSTIISYGKELQTVEWKEKNVFAYELLIPMEKRNEKDLIFRQDLERLLDFKGGVELVKEKRIMKCRVLSGKYVSRKNTSTVNLNANQGKPEKATPIRYILYRLTNILEDKDKRIVFMDDTGLTTSDMLVSDIKIPESTKSIEEVRKVIKEFGLNILEVEREVEVLIVRDKVK